MGVRKTHCKNGHQLSGDNLGFTSGGWRYCRTCRKAAPTKVKPFDQYVEVKSSGCWEWSGRRGERGYGFYKRQRTHRIAWEKANGPIPPNMHICHRCDNPPCVNPGHLFLGTKGDNARDMHIKGRAFHPRKLTEQDVVAIRKRRASGEGLRALAREYAVAPGTIFRAVNGEQWNHVPKEQEG
jgi:hypothetical protein